MSNTSLRFQLKIPHPTSITSCLIPHLTPISETYNNLSFEYESSLKFSHTSTHSSVSTSTTFITSPFQADQKHIAAEIEKEWETVWEVFPELSANPGKPVTNPPSISSTTQAIIFSTTQISILTNVNTTTSHNQPHTSGHLHHTQHPCLLYQLQEIKKIKKIQKSPLNHYSKETCTHCYLHVPCHLHQTKTSISSFPVFARTLHDLQQLGLWRAPLPSRQQQPKSHGASKGTTYPRYKPEIISIN